MANDLAAVNSKQLLRLKAQRRCLLSLRAASLYISLLFLFYKWINSCLYVDLVTNQRNGNQRWWLLGSYDDRQYLVRLVHVFLSVHPLVGDKHVHFAKRLQRELRALSFPVMSHLTIKMTRGGKWPKILQYFSFALINAFFFQSGDKMGNHMKRMIAPFVLIVPCPVETFGELHFMEYCIVLSRVQGYSL